MPVIHVLPPLLANQIAAGEVVERPASIVKELVENSIDAGASCIGVSIIDGGTASITVTDNGCGIPLDQCKEAFLRHATSKISSVDDLASIDSLGFRGEALASIAAVSSVTMTTRVPDSEMGTSICVEGGETLFVRQTACTQGTTVKVENLFAKVPARLRFLKPARFEAGHCADYMSRMILAHPEISFKYVQDGKTVYESFGDGDLKNSVFSVYGNHIYSHLLPVNFDDGYIKIDGYIGTQEISHSNRNLESFFVNGRYIRSSQLSGAVESAFLTKIMIGRYPFCLIRLTIAPKEVDVNVHPAKTQIKFINESRVSDAVSKSCALALKPVVVPKITIPTVSSSSFHEKNSVSSLSGGTVLKRDADQTSKGTHFYSTDIKQAFAPETQKEYKDTAVSYTYNDFETKPKNENSDREVSHTAIPVYSAVSSVNKSREQLAAQNVQESLPISKDYKIIGCAFNAYWIIEYDSDLYLIDQHAACERKLYESIMASEQGIASQSLLFPKLISLPPNDFELGELYRPQLEKIGFRFTKSGSLSYSVEAVPSVNGQLFDAEYLSEAIKLIETKGKAAPQDLIYESLVYSSCKHSIKAGDRITEQEMIALINHFIDDSIPLTCPHGRPVMIKLSKQEIEKGFKRIV